MEWVRVLHGRASLWAARGLDLMFPPRCPFCRRESDHRLAPPEHPAPEHPAEAAVGGAFWSATVCAACDRELSADVRRCLRCGQPGEHAADTRGCQQRSQSWRRIVILSSYAGGLREAVLRAKRPAGDEVVAALASLIVRKHRDTLGSWEIDRVVPVPMHWLRRSLRGTSAADELSRRIAGLLGLPWSRALTRHRATPMQNELPIADRPRNVEGAFRTRRRLDGERILLVDDVVTTGATLSSCVRALLAAGAVSVDVAVVARADRSGADG